MFALLGEIPFEVIGSPEAFESNQRFQYAELLVIGDRPRLQWIAAGLETIKLAMLFHASIADPAQQLGALQAAALDHQARALVFGNGFFRGFFVIESVATSDIQLGAEGAPLAIRVSAVLREWVPGSDLDPARRPTPDFVPLGIAPVAISYSSPADIVATGAAAVPYTKPVFNQPGVSPLVDNPLSSGANGPNLLFGDVPPNAIVRAPR